MEEKGTLTFLLFFLLLPEVLPSVRLLELSPVVLFVVVGGLVCTGGPNRSVNSVSASGVTSCDLPFEDDSDFSRLAEEVLGGVAALFEEFDAAEPGPEDDCSSCC